MSATGRPEREYRSAQREGNPMSTATLLVELVTEELPPKALKRLGEAFSEGLQRGLAKREMLADDSAVKSFDGRSVGMISIALFGPARCRTVSMAIAMGAIELRPCEEARSRIRTEPCPNSTVSQAITQIGESRSMLAAWSAELRL